MIDRSTLPGHAVIHGHFDAVNLGSVACVSVALQVVCALRFAGGRVREFENLDLLVGVCVCARGYACL